MPRFLHTADWQLGLKLRRLDGERRDTARGERFRTVERIAALAKERQVDAVLVAGDVFDDNQLSARTLQRARDALVAFAPIPVLLLPGNHDPAEPGGILARIHEGVTKLPHVHVLLDATPIELGDHLVVHPCPLMQRHDAEDPTRHLDARAQGDTRVRVALAHGGVLDFGASEALNRIQVGAVLDKGFDYLALGDWHGCKQIDARAWYPGAHEPTRFKEIDPGKVLLVEIPEAGSLPQVEPVHVAATRWHEPEPFILHGAEDLDRLEAWFAGLTPRASTLVRLHLTGALHVAERNRLDALLEQQEAEFLLLHIPTFEVRTVIDDDDLSAIEAPGFLGETLAKLLANPDAAHAEASRLLYRMIAEAS